MEQILPNIFRIEIPLKNNPLRTLNSYLIHSQEQNLLVDTGFNDEESVAILSRALTSVGATAENTIIFLTHTHSDHTGLAQYFHELGYPVHISKKEGDIVNGSVEREGGWWDEVIALSTLQGMDEEQLRLEDHPGYKYRPQGYVDFHFAQEGDVYSLPPYQFEAIELRGHSPELLGLWEPEKKVLICGDHILGDITPNITYWGEEHGDALAYYIENLYRVENMGVKYLLTAHRNLVDNASQRIHEIKEHHRKRLYETISTLEKYGEASVRTVTKNLQWDIRSKNWDDFPQSQKWFAAGEAHAHLEYLTQRGIVKERVEDGVLLYSLVPGVKVDLGF